MVSFYSRLISLYLILFPSGGVCVFFVLKPGCCFIFIVSLHHLNIFIYLSYKKLSKLTVTLSVCFPSEKKVLNNLYTAKPHFLYLLFTFQASTVVLRLLFLLLHDLPLISFPSFLPSFYSMCLCWSFLSFSGFHSFLDFLILI